MSTKVLVAMSGGVDSSVAAALLKEQGYEVYGATMQIWPDESKREDGCCSLTAVEDARRVCEILNIPHYVFNFKDKFRDKVIENFCAEYLCGRTPNPCIRCNQFIKFEDFMRRAKELDIEYIATGHYARIGKSKCQISNVKTNPKTKIQKFKYSLLKGRDKQKDQSYALYMMDQKTLAHTLFPIGNLTKPEVRKIAEKYKLPVAKKSESQEICFVPDKNYTGFMEKYLSKKAKPGPIVDLTGKRLGTHKGLWSYTIGQRKGLGIAHPVPLYVIKIDVKKNQLVVGEKKDVLQKELLASNVVFTADTSTSCLPAGTALGVRAKIRYNDTEKPATLKVLPKGKAKVTFKSPKEAITPGQSVVFYKGQEVLGGGIIISPASSIDLPSTKNP